MGEILIGTTNCTKYKYKKHALYRSLQTLFLVDATPTDRSQAAKRNLCRVTVTDFGEFALAVTVITGAEDFSDA